MGARLLSVYEFCKDYQLSGEVQQDQGIRMRVALGVYIIADMNPGIIPLSGIVLGFSFYSV